MFTAVSSTDENLIDSLFGEQTPGADNLLGAKKDEGDQDPDPDKDKGTGKQVAGAVSLESDDDELDILLGGEPADEQDEDKKKELAKVAKPAVRAEKKAADAPLEVDYQLLYKQMVEDGVWAEVEVDENAEWNAELFKEVQKLQVQSQYDDLLDKTGPTGKMIIEYEQNGGNPSEILTLFREQRDVQDFDISSREGQEEFLRSYMEAQGSSEKSIERTIKALVDQGDEAIKEEAEEKKTLWDAQYKSVIEDKAKEQKLIAKQMAEDRRNFQATITKAITSDTEVTPRERKELTNYILDYSQPYKGGQVSQFYLDMLEVQKNPAHYLELAKFVKDVKNGTYQKKVEKKVAREVNARTFVKIKNGAALTSGGGGHNALNSGEESNFLTMLKTRK